MTSVLGLRLALLLREKRWSQAELARRIGVTRAAISYICRGGDPSLALLRRIAAEMGVTESELLSEGPDVAA